MLSTISQIENDIRFDINDFSTTRTLGSFINNIGFSEGYREYQLNHNNDRSYIWNCLSAAGEDIGNVLYDNVTRYVDYVSNIDVCKIQSIRSMMKLLGFEYTIFDKMDLLPLEVQNLMNVASVNRKYFLNGTIKQEFYDDLVENGVISVLDNKDDLSSVFELSSSVFKSGNYTLSSKVFNQDKYYEYLVETYYDLLSGFVAMEFDLDKEDSDTHYYIYKTLLEDIGIKTGTYDEGDEIREFKIAYNIPLSFDQEKIVDDIDNGIDSLYNYQYPLSNLIQMEITKRAGKITKADLDLVGYQDESHDGSTSTLRKTRYSYYRKAKVLEYIKFIDNKYLIDNLGNVFDYDVYDYDPNYFVVKPKTKLNYDSTVLLGSIGSVIQIMSDGSTSIDGDRIMFVSRSLALATVYIQQLREKLKLQARKNYMKGTRNLLLYIINEYLIQYSRNFKVTNMSQISSVDSVKELLNTLENHDTEQLDLIEYYDGTEYYNQQTSTSSKALNNKKVNDDFWNDYDMTNDDGISYKLNEIQKFYLSSMALQDGMDEQELSSFLQMLFNVGADESYLDNSTSSFVTKIGEFDQYSDTVTKWRDDIDTSYKQIISFLSDGYELPDDVISNQISNIVDSQIYNILSSQYLSGLSDEYDKYSPDVYGISSDMQTLIANYNDVISGTTYGYCFKKQEDCKYCYSDEGEYLYNYYYNSEQYKSKYMSDKISDMRVYIDLSNDYNNSQDTANHCVHDTIDNLMTQFSTISSNYISQIQYKITEQIGFVDIDSESMDEELEYANSYVKERYDKRYEYLVDVLNQIRQQANTAKSTYDTIESTFSNIVSRYDDNNTYFQLGAASVQCIDLDALEKQQEGCYLASQNPPFKKGVGSVIYVPEVKEYFYRKTSSDKGWFESEEMTPATQYDESDTLEVRMQAVLDYMDCPTSKSGNLYSYGLKSDGTAASINQLQLQLQELNNTVASICTQIKQIGGETSSIDSKTEIYDKITEMVRYITVDFTEAKFDSDSLLGDLKSYLRIITQLSSQYTKFSDEYQSLFTNSDQTAYLGDYTKPSKITYSGLQDLKTYASNKDISVKQELIDKNSEFKTSLGDLLDRYYTLANSMMKDIGYDDQSSGILESGLENAIEFLVGYYEQKYENGIMKINDIYDLSIYQNVDVLCAYLSDDLSSTDDLDSVVSSYISKYTVTNYDSYSVRKSLFQEYSGIDERGKYPYYNLKNLTHPSYQIHPFLWNFVEKGENETTNLDKVITNIYDEEMSESNAKYYVDSRFGEFGQSVNRWETNDIDYSGYTTRWEQSSHSTSRSQYTSEVIDYDGAFYQPAIDMLMKNYDRCISSIQYAMDASRIRSTMISTLKTYISDNDCQLTDMIYTDYDDNDNLYYTGDNLVQEVISDDICVYLISSDVGKSIDNYFISTELSVANITSLVDVIVGDAPRSYYDRFYKHLGFDAENTKQLTYIVNQYNYYFQTSCMNIISNHTLEDMYDMYRYSVDQNGNSYMLYKVYGKQSPSYTEKQNTLGELWIRMKDTPIAFPAFTGFYPVVYSATEDKMHPLIQKLCDYHEVVGDFVISSDMKCFYDLETSQNGDYVFLNSKIPLSTYSDSDFVQNYQNPWVLICPALTTTIDDVEYVLFRHDDEQNTSNGVRSGASYQKDPELKSDDIEESVTNYSYIGNYTPKPSETCLVYAKKEFYSDHTSLFKNDIKIIGIVNGLVTPGEIVEGSGIFEKEACTGQIAFAYNRQQSGGQLTFAYETEKNYDGEAFVKKTNTSVDLENNTIGSTINDPISEEMNSHDIFDTDITIVNGTISGKQIVSGTRQQSITNTNADMSYIPVYPGEDGEVSTFYLSGYSDQYMPIELLGCSKNIDSSIEQVNVSVDPYYDLSSIYDDFLFGRVYEDYIDDEVRRQVLQVKNASITNYAKNNYYDSTLSSFVWCISLSSMMLDQQSAKNTQIMFYNITTLGKNPYLIQRLTSVPNEWTVLEGYLSSDQEYDSAEQVIHLEDLGGSEKLGITGVIYGTNSQNTVNSNHIDNIDRIMIRLENNDDYTIQLAFHIKDLSKIDHTYIQSDTLSFVACNDKNIDQFKYYHYLDVFGVANARYSYPKYPLDYGDTGWLFHYDKEKYTKEQIVSVLMDYYKDIDGHVKYLKDVDFKKYDYLSDVYILNEYNRLSFKYSEEDRFDVNDQNYYFPTFNTKYPRTIGNWMDDYSIMAKQNSSIQSLFGDNNLFIIDMMDPDLIAGNIGRVSIPVDYDDLDCLRSFEKYTKFEDGTFLSDGYDYDTDDMRFIEAIQFTDISGSGAVSGYVDAMLSAATDIQNFLYLVGGNSDLSARLFPIHHEVSKGNVKLGNRIVRIGKSDIDLSKLLKLYVNYKKNDDETITLYFNYFNYLDTPFVKMDGNKIYPDIIDGTYLKLDSGDRGYIDIVTQLKYYVNGKIYGIKNMKLGTYSIINISDDKPKFMIQVSDTISKDSLYNTDDEPNVVITVGSVVIDGDSTSEDYQKVCLNINVQYDQLLKPYSFAIEYPYEIIGIDKTDYRNVDRNDYSIGMDNGYTKITVEETGLTNIKVYMKTNITKGKACDYSDFSYMIDVVDADIVGTNGFAANVSYNPGKITVDSSGCHE